MAHNLILPVLLLMFAGGKISAQAGEAPFAVLVDIGHACSGSLGFAEFALTGEESSHYIYYWEHGPTDLRLEDLPPGQYVFVVEDVHGCVQKFPVEIYLIDGCSASYEILYGTKPCFATIVVSVFSGGHEIEEEAIDVIEWSDGYAGGLIRHVPVPQYFDSYYGLHLAIAGQDGLCCEQDLTIGVPANPACNKKKRSEVIVNEFNRGLDGSGQYVELLVIGSGECGDTFDLRGYMLDDNNGELVRGGSLLFGDSIGLLGIDEGFLFFSWDTLWSKVPNGSLIVIYDESKGHAVALPPDDPEDFDGDGVYVLPANSPLLFGKGSYWDVNAQEMKYEGAYQQPSWSFVNLSEPADGIQVRYPDAEYCHGLSMGQPVVGGLEVATSQNPFYLYLDSISISGSHCSFTGEDYSVKTDFTCDASSAGTHTPGQANSDTNAAFIYELRHCNDTLLFYAGNNAEENSKPALDKENALKCYPNPTKSWLELQCLSVSSGQARLILQTADGLEVFSEELLLKTGVNRFYRRLPLGLSSGLYLLEVSFPDGERSVKRVVIMK